jgi:NADH:ubiquinone oxidoreductase subunit K
MVELFRSTDPVLVMTVEALLGAADIDVFVLDSYVSAMEGSIGAFPRRVMVLADELDDALTLLIEAGFGKELGSF